MADSIEQRIERLHAAGIVDLHFDLLMDLYEKRGCSNVLAIDFLEDFRVGQLFRHKVGKTVTEGLFNAFSEFGMTTNPLCKNLRYAQRYGFRGLLANRQESGNVRMAAPCPRSEIEELAMRDP